MLGGLVRQRVDRLVLRADDDPLATVLLVGVSDQSGPGAASGGLAAPKSPYRRLLTPLLAALELPWSTGPVEGQITRLKLIKRQGYGRCSLDTLKRRFLYAA
jgi:hypothetical protein